MTWLNDMTTREVSHSERAAHDSDDHSRCVAQNSGVFLWRALIRHISAARDGAEIRMTRDIPQRSTRHLASRPLSRIGIEKRIRLKNRPLTISVQDYACTMQISSGDCNETFCPILRVIMLCIILTQSISYRRKNSECPMLKRADSVDNDVAWQLIVLPSLWMQSPSPLFFTEIRN